MSSDTGSSTVSTVVSSMKPPIQSESVPQSSEEKNKDESKERISDESELDLKKARSKSAADDQIEDSSIADQTVGQNRKTPIRSTDSRILKTTPVRSTEISSRLSQKLSTKNDKELESVVHTAVSSIANANNSASTGSSRETPTRVSGGSVTITPSSDRNMTAIMNQIISPAEAARHTTRKSIMGHRQLTQQGWQWFPEVGERGSCDSPESDRHLIHGSQPDLRDRVMTTTDGSVLYSAIPSYFGIRCTPEVRYFDGNIHAYRMRQSRPLYHNQAEGMSYSSRMPIRDSFSGSAPTQASSTYYDDTMQQQYSQGLSRYGQSSETVRPMYDVSPAPLSGQFHHSSALKSRADVSHFDSGDLESSGGAGLGTGTVMDSTHHGRSHSRYQSLAFDRNTEGYPQPYYSGDWRELDPEPYPSRRSHTRLGTGQRFRVKGMADPPLSARRRSSGVSSASTMRGRIYGDPSASSFDLRSSTTHRNMTPRRRAKFSSSGGDTGLTNITAGTESGLYTAYGVRGEYKDNKRMSDPRRIAKHRRSDSRYRGTFDSGMEVMLMNDDLIASNETEDRLARASFHHPSSHNEGTPLTPVCHPVKGNGPPEFQLGEKEGLSSRITGTYLSGIDTSSDITKRMFISETQQSRAHDLTGARNSKSEISSSSSTPVALSNHSKTVMKGTMNSRWPGQTITINNLDEYAKSCPRWKTYLQSIQNQKDDVVYLGTYRSYDSVTPCDFALKIVHGDRNGSNTQKSGGRSFELDLKQRKQHISYWFVHREVMLGSERGSEVLREAMEGKPSINIVEMDLGGDIINDFPSILMYMYRGSTQITSDQLLPVRAMVQHLRINGSLEKDLIDQFEKNLKEENVLTSLEQARELSFTETEIQCSDKIMQVFTLIHEIEWFKLSMELLVPLLHSAFTRYDSVLIPSHLLYIVMRSLENNPTVRSGGKIYLSGETARSARSMRSADSSSGVMRAYLKQSHRSGLAMNRKCSYEKLRELNNCLASYDFIHEISHEYAFQICKIVDNCWPEMNENMKLQRIYVYRKAMESLRNSLPFIQTSQSPFNLGDESDLTTEYGDFSREMVDLVVGTSDQDMMSKVAFHKAKRSLCEEKNVNEKRSGLTLDDLWNELKGLSPMTLREILILSPRLNGLLIEKIVEYYFDMNNISVEVCPVLSFSRLVVEHSRNFPGRYQHNYMDRGKMFAKSTHRIGHYNGGPPVLKIDSSVTRPSTLSHHLSSMSATESGIRSAAVSTAMMSSRDSSHNSIATNPDATATSSSTSSSLDGSRKEIVLSSTSNDRSAMSVPAPPLTLPSISSAGDLNGQTNESGATPMNSNSAVDKRKWNGAICVNCNNWRHKFDFTKSQWRNRPRGFRRCKECTGVKGTHSKISPREISAKRMRPLGAADSFIVSTGFPSTSLTNGTSLFGLVASASALTIPAASSSKASSSQSSTATNT